LLASADIAYVANAAALTAPNLPAGRLGVVTIDGERIMYRVRDIALNTLSGLRRGTAGTAATDHAVGAEVYNITGGNLLAQQYQDYVVSQTFVADGSTTVFRVTDFDVTVIDPKDSSTGYINDLVEVYVAGVRQYPVGVNKFGDLIPSQYPFSVASLSELVIDFYTDNDPVNPVMAPPAGVEITVLQRRGTSWYNTGAVISASAMIAGDSYFIDNVGTTDFVAVGSLENTRGVLFTATGPASGTGTVTTASNGVALQESTTVAARFLCGN
jgi:hypothetical protein